MAKCQQCGHTNRSDARFCKECGAVLSGVRRPTAEDQHWLAATLSGHDSSSFMSPERGVSAMLHSTVPGDQQEEVMDQSQPSAPLLFDGRYELISEDEHGSVEAVDHEPWRRCWACDSTANLPGEAFCTNCGAALKKQHYRGVISSESSPAGLAFVSSIHDPLARAILPTIHDHVVADGKILVLLRPVDGAPVTLPLSELAALRVGAGMAHLLDVLHSRGMVLGKVAPEDLHLTVDGLPQLVRTPLLCQTIETEHPEAVHADLQDLAGLLEELTGTPRTTRRLNEAQSQTLMVSNEESDTLAAVLSQVRTEAITDAQTLANILQDLISDRTRPLPLHQRIGAASNTGSVRDHNEDSLLSLELRQNNASYEYSCGLFVVADGMGGHAAGEVASYLAVRRAAETLLAGSIIDLLDPEADYQQQRIEELLHDAVLQANEAIRRESHARGNDMGTTIAMALVIGDRATIANVGDSRVYLYRDGTLRRISQDHSLVMRLVELGQLTENEIYSHPQRNAVLRSLGDQGDIEVDLFVERLRPDDGLLLCSDGQWEMTRDPQMARIIQSHGTNVQDACAELIDAANQAGGEDNITSILIRFEAVEP